MASTTWLVPAIGAQLAFACAVFIDKAVLSRFEPHPTALAIGSAVLNLLVAAFLLVVLGPPPVALADAALMLVAGSLLFLYLVPYLSALELDDASVVAPLFQLVPLFVIVLTVGVLGEGLTRPETVGVGAVLIGATVFALGDGRTPAQVRWRTFKLMAGASLVIAIQLTLLDHLLEEYSFLDTAPYVALGLGLTGAMAALRDRRNWRELSAQLGPRGWAAVGGAEVLSITGEALLAIAVAVGPVALVAVTTGLEPVFLVGLGVLGTAWMPTLIHERVGREVVALKCSAVLVILGGLAAMSMT